jgi:quinol-cytochrome oxidoreductase complex cytochrome b subunit
MIPRFYVMHVLIIPAIILALIAAHLALVWYQKHTQFPGPAARRTTSSASGSCRSSPSSRSPSVRSPSAC